MINITFPDGVVKQYEAGVTGIDIAKSISEGLAKSILVAKINGQVWDLTRPIYNDATIVFFKWNDNDGKQNRGDNHRRHLPHYMIFWFFYIQKKCFGKCAYRSR